MKKFDFAEVWRVEAWTGFAWEFIGWASSYERAAGAIQFAKAIGVRARLREA